MGILKKLGLGSCALLVVVAFAHPAKAKDHPKYLWALSDLRTARDFIQADQRPGIGEAKHHAIEEINKALEEVKHAAWDDGKQTKYAPPPKAITDPWTLLKTADGWLYNARKHVSEGVDQPANQGLRDRAVMHIDEAKRTLESVMPPR